MAAGDPIVGVYYGTAFIGTVISERAHSIRWDVREVRVALQETTYFHLLETLRSEILINVCGACGNTVKGFGPSMLITREKCDIP